jgi:protein-tyrosine phosphatase
VIEIVHPALPAPGRLFAGPRPDPPYAAAAAALREGGITTVISLLGDGELPPALERAYEDVGLALRRFPIADFGVPADAVAFRSFLERLLTELRAGEGIYMHCAMGRGRTGTALACLLLLAGAEGDPVALTRALYRRDTVETAGQRAFVVGFRERTGG